MQRNGVMECSVCHSKVVATPRSISRAYDKHKSKISSKQRVLNFLLVSGDCVLVGLQPILVFMCKVDGKFQFSPISVNFLTELTKVFFAMIMLIIEVSSCSPISFPHLLFVFHSLYLFRMQLYFNPSTVKMLSNLKVLVIAVLLKFIMRRKFSIIQWEALALLIIGISVNQLRSMPEGTKTFGLPVTAIAYIYTLIFVTVPSFASIYNEYALKSQFDTNIYLQNVFLYGYGANFSLLGILGTVVFQGPECG
ncbi:CMP-sialic acid transporter 4-like [Hordeum vulgare subsp. vulgare]|uniref:CMP-sialic acid transporter 4-like n=1 Tax=Hordeum vulgare subsp. vulgare TaxID=112509 RepID=UPI001D1A380E|nr:CMP-sialic acid transporter 4-like [Hordeum vulgare subsp. vulgare]